MTSQVEVLTISKVFRRARYVVPVYQRAYAWRDDEIVQLLTDVRDARRRESDYYIGTLVVHRPGAPHDHDYEVVDGQQRLTTLALILSHPRVRAQWDGQVSLTYEGRPDSQDDLLAITEYSTDYLGDDQVRQARDVGIHHGVGVIRPGGGVGGADGRDARRGGRAASTALLRRRSRLAGSLRGRGHRHARRRAGARALAVGPGRDA